MSIFIGNISEDYTPERTPENKSTPNRDSTSCTLDVKTQRLNALRSKRKEEDIIICTYLEWEHLLIPRLYYDKINNKMVILSISEDENYKYYLHYITFLKNSPNYKEDMSIKDIYEKIGLIGDGTIDKPQILSWQNEPFPIKKRIIKHKTTYLYLGGKSRTNIDWEKLYDKKGEKICMEICDIEDIDMKDINSTEIMVMGNKRKLEYDSDPFD